ncbi:MAG: ABC transporter substrate-binding protein [Spirulina sp.]
MKYSRIARRLTVLAIAFITSLFIACNTAPQRPLKVGTLVWPGFEPLYLARDLGYFDRDFIQLVEYSANGETIQAFVNGAIDMMAITLNTTLSLFEKEPDIRVWLLTDISEGADALIGQPNIANIRDLEGTTVGVDASVVAKFLLARALESVNLSPDAVEQIILEIPEQIETFTNKEIDALATYEPIRSQLLDRGGNILFDSRQIPGEIIDVIIGRKNLKDSFSKQLQVLTKGWFKALQYIQDNPDDAMQRMAERQGVTKEQFIQSLNGLSFVDLPKNQALLSGEKPELWEGAKRVSAFLTEQGLLENKVNTDSLFDDRFVKEISL